MPRKISTVGVIFICINLLGIMHLISLYVSAEQKVYSILCVIPTVKHWMATVREFVIISATE